MAQQAVTSNINQWGNGLAVRLGKLIAKTAGVQAGTPVRIVAQPGRIVIEAACQEPTLDEMLAAFDLTRHGGEVMAFTPRGREVL
jgi:mRNA interferase MazF